MRRLARSGSTCTCRSYAPRTSSRARADGSVTGASGKKHVLLRHGRRPLDVEGRDRLHPPRLSLRALGLRPHDGLVSRVEDQEAPGADFDAVSARLIGVEEERLL